MAEFQSKFTGQEIENTIDKLRNWLAAGIDGTYPTVTISSVTYDVIWKVIPTPGAKCYGIGLDRTTGRPYEIYYDGSSYKATALDTNTDTKNTAGSTNSTSTLYLVGASVQAANPQTYSNSKVYMTDGTLTTSSIMTGDIKSSSSSLNIGATSSDGITREVATFYADSVEGTSATLSGHLAVFGDDDSSDPYKPADKTGCGDLDTQYFNTGIALHDAGDSTKTYKLSFPAKSGTFATLDDTKIEIVDLTVVA